MAEGVSQRLDMIADHVSAQLLVDSTDLARESKWLYLQGRRDQQAAQATGFQSFTKQTHEVDTEQAHATRHMVGDPVAHHALDATMGTAGSSMVGKLAMAFPLTKDVLAALGGA